MRRRGPLKLFGPFVEPPSASVCPAERAVRGPRTPGGLTAEPRDLDLHLETGEGTSLAPQRSRICETAAGSFLAHAAGLSALIAVPLLSSSSVPQPADVARVFFVEPMVAPPPPPPPPPAPRARAAATKPPLPETATPDEAFVAPVEIPTTLRPEEGLDLVIEGGVAGGIEGGVPGGIVGGVVGGLPDTPAPPPPAEPLRAGVHVKRPVKVKHVAPVYPSFAADARITGLVILEALIDERGRVAKTTLLRGMPLLSEAVLEAVRQWVYTPTLINGVPIPVTMIITVKFERVHQAGPGAGSPGTRASERTGR